MATELDLWAVSVLKGLGAPLTEANLAFLKGWAQRENVPQTIDRYNYLGTTLPLNGSHGTNGPGVQSYNSLGDGIAATVKMLSQSNFAPIRGALASGQPQAFSSQPQVQSAFRLWSGGGYSWPTTASGSDRESLSAIEKVEGALEGIAGWRNPGKQVGDIGGALGGAAEHIPGVSQAEAVAGFLGKLTDPAVILRGLQIAAGAGMVAIGAVLLAKQIALGGLENMAPAPVRAAAGGVSS